MRGGDNGKPEPVGVPYGSRARLILLRLQSEALRTQSRDVELGNTLRDWLTKMGIPVGGRSVKEVRDQTERISRCRLTFEVRHGNRVGMANSEHHGIGHLFRERRSCSGHPLRSTCTPVRGPGGQDPPARDGTGPPHLSMRPSMDNSVPVSAY